MGVDYGVAIIYGYALDGEKFSNFICEQKEKDEEFDIYDWIEESNYIFEYENHYCGISDNDTIYFGIPVYNKIPADLLEELERDRLEDLEDELIRIFGSYNILASDQGCQPELHIIGVLY